MPIDAPIDPDLMPAPGRRPYYILVPSYTRTSAGIKAIHVLCHNLNRIGQSAFLVIHPESSALSVNPELATPLLTHQIARYHFERGTTPIVVYSEVVLGNPLQADVVVRYYGNFPGLLGGDTALSDHEIRYGFSKALAKAVDAPDNVLFIPTSDTRIFHPPATEARHGTCFYASKYQVVHQMVPTGMPDGSIEITRDRSDSQTPAQIAALFRRSELFYCYENSALAMEAALCGCPTVFMPSATFTQSIGAEELGWDGYAWGDSDTEIARARATVDRAYGNYVANVTGFWNQLERFVELTQARAREVPYRHMIALPANLRRRVSVPLPNNWVVSIGLRVFDVFRHGGIREVLRRSFRVLWEGRAGTALANMARLGDWSDPDK